MRDEHVSTTNVITTVTTADYAAVIADLRAKRDEISRTIAMLEAMSQMPSDNRGPASEAHRPISPPPTYRPAEPKAPQPNASGNNGIGDACARIVLAQDGELTTRQVMEQLIASGFELDDRKNPANNVWSALSHRVKVAGDIEKVGKNWRAVRPSKGAQETVTPMNGARHYP
jgi:hypothetical protein